MVRRNTYLANPGRHLSGRIYMLRRTTNLPRNSVFLESSAFRRTCRFQISHGDMATAVNCRSDNSSFTGVSSNHGVSESAVHRNLEKKYRLPDFQHSYTKHPRHPLTAQYTDEAHKFLASHGVDKQLGPVLWPAFVSCKAPELTGFIFVGLDPKAFLWVCKFIDFIFTIDTLMDEGECSDNPDNSCATVLGMTLSLLWYKPNDERLLEHAKQLNDCLTSDESRALVKEFHEDLVHARNKTKNRKFSECWINYVAMRRLTGCVLPFVICSDLLIARSLKVPHIPNSLFHGPEMKRLLLAIADIIAWHNDILSFHKEVILAGDAHNLVKVVCEERNCASYTEAGEIALQLMCDRIADMELAYEQLKAVASSEYHPALSRYMSTCRDWISGTHQWHLISTRYNIAGTSL